MKFKQEKLFCELVKNHGLNLFLGAGFSVYAYNREQESLPLGNAVNDMLIELFGLEKSRNYNLSKTCQKIKKENEGALEKFLKDTYNVESFDKEYISITRLPIKNIVTTNIDNLLEKIYESPESSANISDSYINGTLEKEKVVNLYKLHGSVTYPLGDKMSFTEKELTDIFVRDNRLFESVSYKLATAPTIFWGTSLKDNNTLELIANSEYYSKNNNYMWIVVNPSEKSEEEIEDLTDLGFNIIEADTKELIEYLSKQSFVKEIADKKYIYREYREKFPSNFVCNELKRSGVRRPVVDFFSGSEPQISDIVSKNVPKTSYFLDAIDIVISGDITLITGIPGCGKSTLLMQLAFSDEINGRKFWFNNIIKQEAERLIKLVESDDNVIVFIDNLYSNVDAVQVLKAAKNVKLVIAERALNYEYVKRFLNISSDRIIDISNLSPSDVQVICNAMNRSSAEAVKLIGANSNISLLEIVFFITNNVRIQERVKRYIYDLSNFKDENLKIDLLEIFTLVNYTSYCGIPCSMDMMYFYFCEDIDTYKDILYALEKMNKIIIEDAEAERYEQDQNYMTMRSKLFAEKSLAFIDNKMIAYVLNRFLENINTQIIYRYDIFKRRAYDADITNRAFNVREGIEFYNKLLKNSTSPYIRHQFALFLQRKKEFELAWQQIDQAYTESKKRIFSIANTHAIIMFEKNMNIDTFAEEDLALLKDTIEKSFSTLEYCITKDVRVYYHVLTYARHTIRYYTKFKIDEYAEQYIKSAAKQLNITLNSGEYIFQGTYRELKKLDAEIKVISSEHNLTI